MLGNPYALAANSTLSSMNQDGGKGTSEETEDLKLGFSFDDDRNPDSDKYMPKVIKGGCGKFTWKVRWTLGKKSVGGVPVNERPKGFIIQKVTIETKVFACKTNLRIPQESYDPHSPYWEMWELGGSNRDNPWEDTYKFLGGGEGTWGSVTYTGRAKVFERRELKPGDIAKFRPNGASLAGTLRGTEQELDLDMNGAMKHDIRVTWNCCEGATKVQRDGYFDTPLP